MSSNATQGVGAAAPTLINPQQLQPQRMQAGQITQNQLANVSQAASEKSQSVKTKTNENSPAICTSKPRVEKISSAKRVPAKGKDADGANEIANDLTAPPKTKGKLDVEA